MPEVKEPGGFFRAATYEELADALGRTNAWIAQETVEVTNVETVVLPNMLREDGPEDIELRTISGDLVLLESVYPRGFAAGSTRRYRACLLYTSPSPRDLSTSRMPSSA